MTCQGCWIQGLVAPRIHSDQPALSRLDANTELVIGWCRVLESEGVGLYGVPHASAPSLGQTAKTVSPLGVTCRQGWPPDGEYPEVAQSRWSPEVLRIHGLRGSNLWTRYCSYRKNFGRSPDTAAPDDR